mmetsp:Transcript_1332/g.2876  ORF Transcript_1332/g.2876 Transcript_1332/m.2876 type:complete len:983 (+) Transcript_1332:67-3015(+)|eukprot:CAMPEP_0172532770 /NCGR_PEP_ID=MMETSP1067-20121228/5699_1 /TAXON_ID=265564 ORGANISM="Thalassiosira punctigera, Strain Tpunct2005C2" /NCGR_SAMPLE_ID=MMETSP1067 /ASSEMBLY_ACC=CAM_ASM_000444 /LENGTH=982 /DNA_ID=CAMNT_0013317323 /DNA_START=30 /DNA_END=2981 /DNA_ORIENTATION=-
MASQEDQLRQILSQSLSPDATTRRNAEAALLSSRSSPGHALAVLRVVSASSTGNNADMPIRQSAAVHFKNMVKKGWSPDEDDEKQFLVPESDRAMIKNNLVDLMCTVPPQLQSQCSESIALIAATDFPSRWDNLLGDLIAKFGDGNWDVINGVLLTANSIIKRFRYVQRSDELYADILYVLKRLQEPLTKLFATVVSQLDNAQLANNAAELTARLSALRSINRIFYSLNYQDLPEYFEDHMGEWMAGFAKLLEYKNPILVDEDEEMQPGPIDNVQVSVVQNLNLYGNKDEEPFIPYLPQFTSLVWNLLMTVTPLSKHDALATTSIRFLSSLIGKLMHRKLFEGEGTLREIFVKIVIPNLAIREIDEERFEDDPAEFILSDMESSDTESRRKCTQELLRAMCRQFEAQTTGICSEHVSQMLGQFAADGDQWKMKDVAIHLMLGIAIRAESAQFGVSQVNEGVNVMDFFSGHVLTELQEADMTVRPMVKATSIKFVSIFRNQFTKEQFGALMPLLIAHLGSGFVVVQTYAAAAIEKMLTAKVDGPNNTKVSKIGGAELKPFLSPLFTGLFSIVDNANLNENEYVMKCVMRALNVAKDDLMEVVQVVLEKLTTALARVAKNPKNPQYNHFLFESIAVLIRAVCTQHSAHTAAFEQFLFPPFQTVLQMEVVEFTPYVFQLLAQILEFRPEGAGLGEAYTSLFPPLLTPTLWERKGNVPALTRLLTAYLNKGPNDLVPHLLGILGVFQKLVSSKANEQYAFDLLRGIVMYMHQEVFMPRMKDILQILMMKLQQSKTPKYVGLITHFFALFIGKFGPQAYLDQLNQLQPGMGLMLLVQVWVPRLQAASPTRLEAKTQMVGLTKLLCETPALLADANGQQIWSQILFCAVKIVCSPDSHLGALSAQDNDDDAEIGYDATFSVLHFATRPARDPFPEVQDAGASLVRSVGGLCASHPGQITPMIARGLSPDPKLSAGFDGLCQKAGVQLS